jgi:hypothetical protein
VAGWYVYIVDPTVARDFSPDPRRHSLDKFVPDIVALRGDTLLIVEAKPDYSESDYEKLERLLAERRDDLHLALRTFGRERGFPELLQPELLSVRPALAFGAGGVQCRTSFGGRRRAVGWRSGLGRSCP